METRWTEEQQRVIQHREGDLLVSAAAGSGKTAVLVQHVISRLLDPVDPVSLSEMVIMTFTEAAAAEMREKIRKAIEEELKKNPEQKKLIAVSHSLQNASISTIDAFCKRIILENYTALDIDPDFSVLDENEAALMSEEILDELLEESYAASKEDFLRFSDSVTSAKNQNVIKEWVLTLHRYAQAMPWPKEYLDSLLEEREAEQYYLSVLRSYASEWKEKLREALELCRTDESAAKYETTLAADLRQIEALDGAESVASFSELLSGIRFSRIAGIRNANESAKQCKAMRDMVKGNKQSGSGVQGLQGKLLPFNAGTRELIQNGVRRNTRVLVGLTQEFEARYQEKKKHRKVLDFSDLEHDALEILYTDEDGGHHLSDTALHYAGLLREILIDEYQDTNGVQEALIEAISGKGARLEKYPSVFQVGDVKQSIYGFRQAEPDIFLRKYLDPDYPSIELSKNFRSRSSVLDITNHVFRRIMKRELGGIDYDERVSLHQGSFLSEEDGQDRRKFRPELLLVSRKEPEEKDEALSGGEFREESSGEVLEARLIAKRIRQLIREGYRYKDIVILARSLRTMADLLVKTLFQEGIPSYATSSRGYFTKMEVELLLSLLRVIDNPRQSIPLAAVMHSPMYRFSEEELAVIVMVYGTLEERTEEEEQLREGLSMEDYLQREMTAEKILEAEDSRSAQRDTKEGSAAEETEEDSRGREALPSALSEKLRHFREHLHHFREQSRILRLHELLYLILEETGFYEYIGTLPGGEKRCANIDKLCDMAVKFEQNNVRSLSRFVRFIEKVQEYEEDMGEASVYGENDDLVRIMSIHKSKGLQFPVVILAGMGKNFNQMDLRSPLLLDRTLGISMKYVDPAERIEYTPYSYLAIREKKRQDMAAEELRVLYVAMTRAVDKLIMTGVSRDLERLEETCEGLEPELPLSLIRDAKNYMEWIMFSEGAELKKTLPGDTALAYQAYQKADLDFQERQEDLRKEGFRQLLMREAESFPKEDERFQRIAASLCYRYPHEAATKLYPKYSVSEIKEKAIRERKLDLTEQQESGSLSFPGESGRSSKNEGSLTGDAYHHLMAAYRYDRSFAENLLLLPVPEQERIRRDRVETFLNSRLGQRFAKAFSLGQLYREQHFMKAVPYPYLFPESEMREEVLLQGIIDAFFMEGEDIVLVDYKTDRVRDGAVLRERYARQLQLYRDALEALSGKRVREMYLYSFPLGTAVEV